MSIFYLYLRELRFLPAVTLRCRRVDRLSTTTDLTQSESGQEPQQLSQVKVKNVLTPRGNK